MYVFSSNYELYASLSNRVVALLEELSPRVEQYSIDECFLDARGIGHCMDLEDFGRQLRGHVLSGTGLTIGVGFGATKTLAKSAQWASKEWPQFSGVLALSPENPRRTAKLLSLQPVEEIWGVGNRIAKKLHVMGITTALQLSLTNPTFIRKNFNVVLERTVRELNGELHFAGGSAAAETADCLQSQLRAADHHLRRNAPGRLPVCRARGGKVAR